MMKILGWFIFLVWALVILPKPLCAAGQPSSPAKNKTPATVASPGTAGKVSGTGEREQQKKTQRKPIRKKLPSEAEKMLEDLDALKTGNKIQVSLSGDVLFEFNKWEIRGKAEKVLKKLAKAIKKLDVREILIEGYTDAKGSAAYNLELSKRRAEAVKSWLMEKGGLKGITIVTKGRGEANPVAPNTNPDGSDNPRGRAKNRRVEIFVTLLGN